MQVVHADQGFEQTVTFVLVLLAVGDDWCSAREGKSVVVPKVRIWVAVVS